MEIKGLYMPPSFFQPGCIAVFIAPEGQCYLETACSDFVFQGLCRPAECLEILVAIRRGRKEKERNGVRLADGRYRLELRRSDDDPVFREADQLRKSLPEPFLLDDQVPVAPDARACTFKKGKDVWQ